MHEYKLCRPYFEGDLQVSTGLLPQVVLQVHIIFGLLSRARAPPRHGPDTRRQRAESTLQLVHLYYSVWYRPVGAWRCDG